MMGAVLQNARHPKGNKLNLQKVVREEATQKKAARVPEGHLDCEGDPILGPRLLGPSALPGEGILSVLPMHPLCIWAYLKWVSITCNQNVLTHTMVFNSISDNEEYGMDT